VSLVLNLTNAEVAYVVGMGIHGGWQVTAVAKVSYSWDHDGGLSSVRPAPLLTLDQLAGEPGSSGLLQARESGPLKPKVDVLLAGALAFPRDITEIEVELAVGVRIVKRARVFGDRVWLPGTLADLVPSDPRPVKRVPIAWERCYGGNDPTDEKFVEPRNPVGSGVAKDPTSLHGRPVPNFEEIGKAIGSVIGVPAPIGFGPIADHWPQRVALAGTYDAAWAKTRRPLLPEDLSTTFFNVAPADQQLDGYLPDEEVRLLNMSTSGSDHFCMPAVNIPVAFVTNDEFTEDHAKVDTIVIEPEERRLSLLAKAEMLLPGGPQSLGHIIVGEISTAVREAIETGVALPERTKSTVNG